MIIYVASFPRSGNSWIRRLLLRQFDLMPSSVHPGGWERMQRAFPEWRLADPQPRAGDPLSAWIASCTPPGGTTQALLLPGCAAALTDEHRKTLAARSDRFVLKTHERPFRTWFDGERVVHVVRHAGGALHSYHRFLESTEPPAKQLRLRALVAGAGEYGCWSDYHETWERARAALGERSLLLRFEDLRTGEAATCEALSRHLGLPWRRRPFERFEELHAQRPLMFRSGDPDAWRAVISADDARVLHDRHGAMLRRLGYAD